MSHGAIAPYRMPFTSLVVVASALLMGASAAPADPVPPAPAVATEPLTLSLDEAVEQAIAAAPRLRALGARARAAGAAERAARSGRLPNLDLYVG